MKLLSRIFTWLIPIVLVLCLPVSALAAGELTPVRSTLYGAIVGNTTGSTYSLPVYTVDSDTFCVVPTRNYNAISQFNFFFSVPSGFTSFKIVYSFDASYFTLGSDGNFNLTLVSYNYNNGALSDTFNLSGAISSQSTSNGRVTITHQWRGSQKDRNCVSVGFLTNITVANLNQYYNFDVEEFIVDGVPVEELAVTETNEGFAEDISNLSESENEWWERVVVPGYDEYFDSPQINQATSDYKAVIKEVSFNNFLVPSLITIVFTLAFYGYVLYGKKG